MARLGLIPRWALLALAGCGARQSVDHAPAASPSLPAPPEMIRPARVVPDIPASARALGTLPDGSRRFLLMSMRLLEHADGSIERAPGLLPSGQSKLLAVSLPSRLGSGFLFAATSSSSTQVWRADSWTAPLTPILRFSQAVTDLIPGFDRIYARVSRTPTAYIAFDPADGSWLDLGSLPSPWRFGASEFADAWRAVVVTDLRGPLTTFNSGASWLPLPLSSDVTHLEARGPGLLVQTLAGSVLLGPDGAVIEQGTLAEPSPAQAAITPDQDRSVGAWRHPLRDAVELGYPYRDDLAVVADRGSVLIVSTRQGKIVEERRNAYPNSYTSCHGIRLGRGIGFVCGEAFGPTAIFALGPHLALRQVMRWPDPRAVFPSPNGSVVVRAPCPDSPATPAATQYCVRLASGHARELRFQGDLGAERVVALTDGRVAIVVAPRPGAEGRLVLLDGSHAVTKSLSFTNVPARMASLIRRGLWLQGAQETSPGVIGVWVEAGGPVVGIQVSADGVVRAGPAQPPSGAVVVAGRFGLVSKPSGECLETSDGGMTWAECEIPPSMPGDADVTRSCSPVGCVLGGTLRVGWGAVAPDPDSEPAPLSEKLSNPPYTAPRSIRLQCFSTGRSSPAALATDPSQSPALPGRIRVRTGYPSTLPDTDPRARGWMPFASSPAPPLSAAEFGVAAGRDYGDFRFRAYAWGPRSSDWTHAGRFVIRVDNPHEPVAGPWSSAIAASPWQDASMASVRINNITAYEVDPTGGAAVVSWCPMPTQCEIFGVTPDAPPLPLHSADSSGLPVIDSIVRTDEGWFLLAKRSGNSSSLWAADRSGAARRIATFPRVGSSYGEDVVVVRKSTGSEIGLWTVSTDTQGNSAWIVLPVDPSTGKLAEPVTIGRTDFGGVAPPRCADTQDGWVIEVAVPTALDLVNAEGSHFGGSIRVLMRAGSGWACVDSISARAPRADWHLPAHKPPAIDSASIPLVAWDPQQNRRFELTCRPPR